MSTEGASTPSTRTVDSGGVAIHVTEAGPSDGTPVLLLHGWPDSAALWRKQIPALAEAGYRVLVPDQRGFGESDRPDGVENYHVLFALSDALAVLDDADVDTAHVVGHDWGAIVSWTLAGGAPDRVRSLTAVSVGHPNAVRKAGVAQRAKAWHMLLFQFEGVAEQWLSDNDWANIREWSGNPTDMERYIAHLSRDGALTATLNWYRANVPPESLVSPPLPLPNPTCPTMGVMGGADFALTIDQLRLSEEFVDGEWRYEQIDGADHWIPLDNADRFNPLLFDWLASH